MNEGKIQNLMEFKSQKKTWRGLEVKCLYVKLGSWNFFYGAGPMATNIKLTQTEMNE